jgi:hypothetical protein
MNAPARIAEQAITEAGTSAVSAVPDRWHALLLVTSRVAAHGLRELSSPSP